MGRAMSVPSVMRLESLKSQNDVDRDVPLCVSKSELEALQELLGWERYGRMSSVVEKRTGSSASTRNAVSNSIVSRDDTGDGTVKLDSGDLIEPGVEVDASLMDPLNNCDDETAIVPLEPKPLHSEP